MGALQRTPELISCILLGDFIRKAAYSGKYVFRQSPSSTQECVVIALAVEAAPARAVVREQVASVAAPVKAAEADVQQARELVERREFMVNGLQRLREDNCSILRQHIDLQLAFLERLDVDFGGKKKRSSRTTPRRHQQK